MKDKIVGNMSKLDGSIGEAFVIDEIVTFQSRYVSNIETRFTRQSVIGIFLLQVINLIFSIQMFVQ